MFNVSRHLLFTVALGFGVLLTFLHQPTGLSFIGIGIVLLCYPTLILILRIERKGRVARARILGYEYDDDSIFTIVTFKTADGEEVTGKSNLHGKRHIHNYKIEKEEPKLKYTTVKYLPRLPFNFIIEEDILSQFVIIAIFNLCGFLLIAFGMLQMFGVLPLFKAS